MNVNQKTSGEESGNMKVTIVFDNNPFAPGVKTAWGFACVARVGSATVLFDTGSDGALLMKNMGILGIEPSSIDALLISHNHWDHIGGLETILRKQPSVNVFIPALFPPDVKSRIEAGGGKPVEIDEHREIVPTIFTLGDMGDRIHEQAMILRTKEGLIIATGCAHPGIVHILERAGTIFPGEPILCVLGGFHLRNTTDLALKEIINHFISLDVRFVAPCHCTGDRASHLFEEAFGDRYIQPVVGQTIEGEKLKGVDE